MPYQHKAQAYSALTFLKDHANLAADILRLYGAWKNCRIVAVMKL
jgi:hypothetical protein